MIGQGVPSGGPRVINVAPVADPEFRITRVQQTLAMEDIHASRDLITAVMQGLGTSDFNPVVLDAVESILSAYEVIEGYALRGVDLSREIIKEIHWNVGRYSILSAGSFRDGQVWINGSKHTPPAWSDVPDLFSDMCYQLAQDTSAKPVMRAAWVHARTAWIHGFNDGNGRLARCLSDYELIKAGFPPAVIPASKKKEYLDALEAADQGYFLPLAHLLTLSLEGE